MAACNANGDALFSDTPVVDGEGGAGGEGGNILPPASANSVDLLLVVDNSRSMQDAQSLLAHAVPELLDSLANPLCVDDADLVVGQPASADDDCPDESTRMFAPVQDIHIGVVSTSLGGHGADACADPSANDSAHLLTRSPDGGEVDEASSLGFLAWEADDDLGDINTAAQDLILGAGAIGCGYEATLESWYRFLVDPDPYDSIRIDGVQAELEGTDSVVLEQRRAFLRPDSMLIVLALSDENDCSIRDGGQAFFAAQLFTPGTMSPYRLPKGRAQCAIDPNDACCRSCGQAPGDGCNDSGDACEIPLSPLEDHVNLRCWEQKRRFGVDFMWPIDRYVAGLTESQVTDRFGNVVANPLFSDLDPTDDRSAVRDPRLVFYATVTGVPWQDIARQSPGGTPDLANGRNSLGRTTGGFQTANELAENGTWKLILGDPSKYTSDPDAGLPGDPLMLESVNPRAGENPITGDEIAPVTAGHDENTINGHEYSIPERGDLQYACVFPLPEPRDCGAEDLCACDDPGDNPQCQQEDDSYGPIQVRGKAYPGIRHLQVAKRLEMQAAVGSVCAAQVEDENNVTYGYRPFVRTLLETVSPVLD